MPHTKPHTTQKRRKRRRWYSDILGDERRENLFWDILNADPQPDIEEWIARIVAGERMPPATRIYLYRLTDGEPVRPAVWSGDPFPEFCNFIRDRFGGGEFLCLIRRGKKMLLSGVLRIASAAKSVCRDPR